MNCFNAGPFLKESIESVINQTYTNWELIFWDNQSSDNSARIVKAFVDPRIKYFYAYKHTKLYEARNLAIQESKGKYIAFLDTDDLWHKEKLEKQVKILMKGEYPFVFSNYNLIDKNSNFLKKAIRFGKKSGMITRELIRGYYIGILTVVFDRSLLDKVGEKFNLNFNHVGDLDFFLRLSEGNAFYYSTETLAQYRVHGNNLSTLKSLELLKELKVLARQMSDRPFYKNHIDYLNDFVLYRKYLLLKKGLERGKKFSIIYLAISMKSRIDFFLKLLILRLIKHKNIFRS
ncbi:glycosyltransferase [Leptospira levettii]|uniref:Glycosyltransferase n=2 Tax=Leptospira levettii TaxID=2023178 RepID=A0AAW5V3L4_9LEPT|nr:glycosyltransferase [Leptospira levettii]MCW7516260.1 glycosyltransferase [Leptospira levettii]